MISTSSANQDLAQSSFLIIGYGNELRGDEAVGPWVARTVAKWQVPLVKSLAVQQLTPELAPELASVNYVMFIDACSNNCTQMLQLNPVTLDKASLTHDMAPVLADDYQPSVLLALADMIYGRYPQAWSLQIPTECFDLGNSLSDTAYQGCDRAFRTIEQFFRTYLLPCQPFDR